MDPNLGAMGHEQLDLKLDLDGSRHEHRGSSPTLMDSSTSTSTNVLRISLDDLGLGTKDQARASRIRA